MLVTHQLQYLHDAKHVVIMNMGQLKAQGSYDYVKNTEHDFSNFGVSDKSSAGASKEGDNGDSDSRIDNDVSFTLCEFVSIGLVFQ